MTSFLDDPYDNEDSNIPKFETVALVKFSLVFQSGWGETAVWFKFDNNSKQSMTESKAEAFEYSEYNGLKKKPQLGILMDMPIETNLTAPEDFDRDDVWFTPSWQNDNLLSDNNAFLSNEEKARVSGAMPYTALVDSLRKFPQILSIFVWMKTEQIINQYSEAKGNKKDGKYPYRFHVPSEIYTNEAEARAAVGIDDNETLAKIETNEFFDNRGLSKKAVSQGWTEESLKENLEVIYEQIAAHVADAGNKNMSKAEATIFVCDKWSVEVIDLNLFGEIPF